jgi:peptidyl-prolyl cis-trans isomerase D
MLHYTPGTSRRATHWCDEKVDAAMMGAMRKFSKSWVAIGLIGLLVISFAVWQVSDAFKRRPQLDVVARVGKEEIKAAEFKTEFDGVRKSEEQRIQRPLSVEEAVAGGVDQGVLDQLATRLAVGQVAKRVGIRIGREMYAKMLHMQPAFFDPITGKFDPKTYQSLLAQNGLRPEQYEKMITEERAQQHLLSALGAGFEASRSHVALQAAYAMQSRDARYLVVDPTKVAKPAAPTEAQLQAYLNDMSAQVMKPELRQLTIVRFSSKAIAPTVQVTPQEIQQVFDFRKDQMTVAETRTVVQITAKSAASAAAIAASLAKGEDPAAVAKAQGAQIVTYADKPKTAIPDRKVADAAFSLAAGQTSGAIAGDLGQTVVKVLAIKPGKTVTLDEVRPQVEEEARTRAAEAKISDMADKFEAAISGGASVAEAAKAVGLTAVVTPAVSAQGQAVDQPGPVAGLSPKLLETAFDLAQGADSELVQDQQGEYFVVHVNRVIAPAMPTVDEVRAPLTQSYMAREYERRLKALADQLAERVRKGEAIDAVAASIGARTGSLTDLSRMNAQREVATFGRGAVGAILAAKLNEVVVEPGPGGIFVAKVGAVHNGDVATLARMTNQARGQISNELVQDYQQRVFQAARDAVKVELFLDNARRAVGASPEEAPAAAGKAKGPAKGKAG